MSNCVIDALLDNPYSLANQTVKKICRPLFKNFDITYFDYARFYPDNTYFIFFTDLEYVKFFLQTPAHLEPAPFLMLPGNYLWSGYIPKEFLCDAKIEFSYCHGMTIIKDRSGYKEVFNFAAAENQHHVLNFYLNKQQTMELFVEYFLSEVSLLIDKHKKHRLVLPSSINMQPLVSIDPETSFLEEIRTTKNVRKDNQLYSINDHLVSLSPREMECINFLKKGLSNKHIARNLDISFRTVEKFLKNIYQKSGINTRSELLLKISHNL